MVLSAPLPQPQHCGCLLPLVLRTWSGQKLQMAGWMVVELTRAVAPVGARYLVQVLAMLAVAATTHLRLEAD